MVRNLLLFSFLVYSITLKAEWTDISPKGGHVNVFGYKGNMLLAGTDYGNLYTSKDSGAIWTKSPLFADSYAEKIFVNGSSIYVISQTGAYLKVSNDEGSTWSIISINKSKVYSLQFSASEIFAGTNTGFYISSDKGVTWAKRNNGLGTDTICNSLLAVNTTLFAGTSNAIYLSHDKGLNWSIAGSGIPFGSPVNDLYLFNSKLLAVGKQKMFISSDTGRTWLSSSISGIVQVNSIALLGNKLFAATSAGFHSSVDNGAIWTKVQNTLASVPINDVIVFGNKLIAGTMDGVSISKDNGITWTPANEGIVGYRVSAVYSGKKGLYVGSEEHYLDFSSNSGVTWNQVTALKGKTVYDIKGSASNMYLACGYSGVFLSTDDGQTWTSKSAGFPASTNVNSIAVTGSTVYAGTYKGVFRSDDNCNSWTLATTVIPSGIQCRAMFATGTDVYASTANGVYYSNNNGVTWTLSSVKDAYGVTVVENIALAINLSGMYKSIDRGTTWTFVKSGAFYDIQSYGTSVYVGAAGGIIHTSIDNGNTWSIINTNISSSAQAIAVNEGALVTGFYSRGVSFMATFKSLSGKVKKINSEAVSNGEVSLFKYSGTNSNIRFVSTAKLGLDGGFTFAKVNPGQYVLVAKPDSTVFPECVNTYFGSDVRWKNAKVIYLKSDSSGLDVVVDEIKITLGKGHIYGRLIEGNNFSFHKQEGAGNPLKGILVSLVDKSNDKVVSTGRTDIDGKFKFDKLEKGSYYVNPDITGIPVDYSGISGNAFAITETDTSYDDLKFIADSVIIQLNKIAVSINSISKNEDVKMIINQSESSIVFIPSSALKGKLTNISVFDVSGRLVLSNQFESEERITINIPKRSGAIYLIRLLTINNQTINKKVVMF